MVNTLTDLRTQVKDALTAAGIKTAEYVQENIVPPIVVVVPASPYITLPTDNRFATHYTVALNLLVIGGKGTNKAASTNLDLMLVSVLEALEDDWDITEVSGIQEMNLKGNPFLGAVVTLEVETTLNKEVI